MTPAQHEKKLQVAVHFRTLAFISVAAVYALSTFGDHEVPTHTHTHSLSTLPNHLKPPCNPVYLRHSRSSGQSRCVPLAARA